MTSPLDAPRPGAWLPVPGPAAAGPTGAAGATGGAAADGLVADDLVARLTGVPVTGHVEVLTAEHERLHRLLATIDQL